MLEPKLLRGVRPKLRLFALCLAILVLGAFSRPPAAPRPATEEKVAPILEARALREEPLRLLEGLRAKAQRGASASFALARKSPRRPRLDYDFGPVAHATHSFSGRGVVVAPGVGLAAAEALGGELEPRVHLASGSVSPARVRAHDVETGLVLLAIAAATDAANVSSRAPAPGDLVLVAFGLGEQATIQPAFVASRDGDRLVLSGADGLVAGMPLFDLEGDLAAIATDGRSAVVAVPALAALRARAEQGGALPSTLGLALQEMDAALEARLGKGGAVVVGVDPEGPGRALAVGDVLLSVGGTRVASIADAQRAIAGLTADTSVVVKVLRNRRELELSATPALALAYASPSSHDPAPRADGLFPASALADVALPGAARVVAIEGQRPRGRLPKPGASGYLLVEAEFEGQRLLAAVKP